ncbi:MAG TPA: exodeoxyribonuclease VII large subunit [Verrucomicrobiota bacterium]|nr:exodeoxyribonuclease VII large subunit [Verrucomicrobiota bacterium]HOK76789.1 exodeoxyribonuclease VII large subunit [Verrucomicrobiota bacterium]
MPSRTASSQWEFGDLLPRSEGRRVFTVVELTSQVKRLLETQIGAVWVSGEITNRRLQSSGHCYFTLKDAFAQLNCVLFRGQAAVDRSLLEDGQKVLVHGALTVYEPRGQYQLIVDAVEPQGIGTLQLMFERLKQKLQAEGLFAPERKRPIPHYPVRIGVVTSPTGAAIRDVIHVISRRNPAVELVLAPCRVQGEGAAAEIAAAIRQLNEWSASLPVQERLDVILVTRGGGSLEDLWAFNEEIVARAIYASEIPVISAVGHEIDFTISDFVADLRAATPSAAAELLTEGAVAARRFLSTASTRLLQLGQSRLERLRERFEYQTGLMARMHPRRRLNDCWQHLDELQEALSRSLGIAVQTARARFENVTAAWSRTRPSKVILLRREHLGRLENRLGELAHFATEAAEQRLARLSDRLRLLSPRHVLARGYSITKDAETGLILRRAADVRPEQLILTVLHEGEVVSTVKSKSDQIDK